LIAAAASCWLIGDLLQRVLTAGGFPEDTVGPQDIFWLGSYPLIIAAVAAMIGGRGLIPGVRRDIRLDVTAVTVAAGLVVWKVMIFPGLEGGTLDLQTVVGALYPLGDVAIFAMALTLLLAPGRRGVPGALLIVCLGSTLVVDTLFSVLPTIAPGYNAGRLDAVLLVVNSLLAAAVLHPSGGALAEPIAGGGRTVHMHRWRVMLLGVAVVAVSIAAAVPSSGSSALDRVVLLVAAAAVSITIVARFYGVVREREMAEAQLVHQAQHDQLTGLANRSLLLERLGGQLLGTNGATSQDLVLLYVDLDGFKAVNDRWGHAAGDHVLRVVGDRLHEITRRGDTVARLGGDEFVVLCLGVPPDAAEALGGKLREAVIAPIELPSGEIAAVGASVGIYASATRDGGDPWVPSVEDLLRLADSAMYEAKHSGGGVRITC
jgi:diguanylate cyclase (GGDEF)-like protein